MYEGDTINFNCPAGLEPLTAGPRDVEWFHDDVKVEPKQHTRIRYVKKTNSVSIKFIEEADSGNWSVRPKTAAVRDGHNSFKNKLAVWCNFTLTVLTDDDAEEEEDVQSDRPLPDELEEEEEEDETAGAALAAMTSADDYHYSQSPPRHPEEDFPTEDGDEPVSLSPEQQGLLRPPSFIRLKRMEAAQSMVKPAGSTITYKCPADGNFHTTSPST